MTESMFYELLVFVGVVSALSASTKIILAIIQRRSAGLSKTDSTAIEDIRARLTRIEQVTEATAVEVERIGEGQRFTTKVLSDRNAPVTSQPR